MRFALYLLLGLQVAGLSLTYHHLAAEKGPRYRLRVHTADPRDLLRGDYVILQPDIATLPEKMATPPAGEVFVRLQEESDEWRIAEVVQTRGSRAGPWVRARWDGAQLRYGIEKYFVPEGRGVLPNDDLVLEISLDRADRAQSRQLFVGGEPWP